MVVQMFHPESFRRADDVVFFSSSSSNSVQLAPQDKSPSRGSLTTWSTVNRQTDRQPKAWLSHAASGLVELQDDLRDSPTSLARLRQLWLWPSLRGLSWCLYVWVWTFLWSASWTKALWADTLGSFYWHHIQMDPQVTGYQAVQIIVSDYSVECDIWKRSHTPLSRNRGWCGGVLP